MDMKQFIFTLLLLGLVSCNNTYSVRTSGISEALVNTELQLPESYVAIQNYLSTTSDSIFQYFWDKEPLFRESVRCLSFSPYQYSVDDSLDNWLVDSTVTSVLTSDKEEIVSWTYYVSGVVDWFNTPGVKELLKSATVSEMDFVVNKSFSEYLDKQ